MRTVLLAGSLVTLGGAMGCDTSIASLNPATGHDRALIAADGAPILYGPFFWDPGASEKRRVGGLHGQMFTVPAGAAVGNHMVERRYFGAAGPKVSFIVDEVRPFPAPRIERVSILGAEFRNAGSTVATFIYVQGGNVDVGAVVELKTSSGSWTAIASMAHKGLANRVWDETWKVPHGGLDYPLYHHLALIAIPDERPVGAVLAIRIRNEDGKVSDEFPYKLPQTASALDSDGDGIPDVVEPTLSTDKLRPDVLLEVDYMEDGANPLRNPWSSDIGASLKEVYGAAPIINPIGPSGVNLVIDGQVIPRNQDVYFAGPENQGITERVCTTANIPAGNISFRTLKRACFDNATRGQYWHYCVWAGQTYYVKDGAKQFTGGFGEIVGDDCIVGADFYADTWLLHVPTQTELLAHELGHNLGLRHGGSTDATHNPTYNSVMSYSWLGRTRWGDLASRKGFPVCTPLYYQLAGAIEVLGAIPSGTNPDLLRGYSDGMGRALTENNLDETPQTAGAAFGVCNNPVDWGCKYDTLTDAWICDDDTSDLNVVRNVNGAGGTTDVLTDRSDWSRLVYNGPAVNGTLKLASDP